MAPQKYILHAAVVGLLLTGSGCSESTPVSGDEPGTGPGSTATFDKSISAGLRKAESCPDLLAQLQTDATAKLDLEIALYKAGYAQAGGDPGFAIGGGDIAAGGSTGALGAPEPSFDFNEGVSEDSGGGAAGTSGTSGGTGTSNGGATPPTAGPSGEASDGDGLSAPPPMAPTGGSTTNNQVSEVDEADFVKVVNDHTRMYLLHGTDLYAMNTWPAADLAQLGQPFTIEGNPSEMFVNDGKAVVFSSVNAYDVIDSDDGNRNYQQYTKVSVIDASGSSMKLLRELYIEGSYTSSRRYDSLVRAVVQAQSPAPNRFYPDIEPYDQWGRAFDEEAIDAQLASWRERTASSIANTELHDWLPRQYERSNGQLSELTPACPSHYTPVAGVTDYGLTRVVALDMAKPAADPGGVTIVGAASIVYSNTNTLLLAHNDYRWDARDFGLMDDQRTALHTFALNGDDTIYQASGWVSGHVLNQFALDEADGVVRVSTSGWQRVNPDAGQDSPDFWNTEPVNQVITLRADGVLLGQLDTTGPIGDEGETTRSTRFIGDRAYVVTFLQQDPLIVVDVSNPEELVVKGEAHIPGFSEYMHPLGDDHLLTIGQDADDNGFTTGLALQIFDVSDDTNPMLKHKETFSASSSSSASYDHKNFIYYAEQNLLAFPMVDWGNQFSSTLQVYRVSTKNGFKPLGAVDHSELFGSCIYSDEWGSYWQCNSSPDVRRGLFIQDSDDTFVYTISFGGVTAHNIADLDNAVGQAVLPEPGYYYTDYYGGEDGWISEPGFGGGDFGGTSGTTGVAVGGGVAEPEPAPAPETVDAGVMEPVDMADGGV